MPAFDAADVVTTNIFDGPTEITVDGSFIGATVGGVELVMATEYGEMTSDQSPLLHGSYIKSQRGTLKFSLEDLSLDNMRFVFATSATTGAGGGNESIIPLRVVEFKGHGPAGTTRTYRIHKARFKGNTTGKHTLGETVVYPVELLMESDTTKLNGERYFTITDS